MTNVTPCTIATDNGYSYIGDMNILEGGVFIRVSDDRSYADVIEVIDASNANIPETIWVDERTVPIDVAGKAKIKSALDTFGTSISLMVAAGYDRDDRALRIAHALHTYGWSDSRTGYYHEYSTNDNILEIVNDLLCNT